MTIVTRSLSTPRIEARTFAVGLTAAAAHASTLTELANDAASGRPSQRMTLPRVIASGVLHTYWIPTAVPRFLRVAALITSRTVTINGVSLKLAITDSLGNNVPYTAPEIPDGLDGSTTFVSGYTTANPSRLGAGDRQTWTLDVAALVAAGLDLTADWWRFEWTPTVTSPAELESCTVEEVPRFAVDDSETFGQIGPSSYLPRGLVVDGSPGGLQRVMETARVALMLNLRTYHCLARPEADPWLVSATSLATFGGSDEESAGAPAKYRVRPRAIRASVDTRVRYVVRYKIVGAVGGDTATVRLSTGAGNYDATLTDVSGSWADGPVTTAYLLTGATDTLSWKAMVSNGASVLHLVTRVVSDYPEA